MLMLIDSGHQTSSTNHL